MIGCLVAAQLIAFTYAPPGVVGGDDVGIRGAITRIHRASAEEEERFIGTVLVERDDKAGESVDKANLIITAETHIYIRQGEGRRRAAFEDLGVGDVVEARFVEGPTVMMYPLRVEASEVVVLNRGRAEERRLH